MSRVRKSWAKSLALVGILGVLVFSALLVFERLGTPGASPSPADDLVQQGKDLLVANTSMVQLGNADTKFQQALAADPTHPEANAYRAVTRFLVLFNVPASAGGAIDSVNELLDRLGVSSSGRNIYNWTADFSKDLSGHMILPPGAPSSAEILQFLETHILPEIDAALANLSHVSSGFEVTLPAQIFGMHSNKQQLLGYGEVAVYRAFLQALRGMILFSRSYDLDVNLVNLNTQLHAHTFQITRDLLEAYPNFLTLIDLSKLSTAQTNLKAAIDSYVEGAGVIRARSPEVAEQYLIHLKEADLDREQIFRNMLVGVLNSLDGLATIDLGRQVGGPAQVNLNQFFSTGTNLRSMLPTFTTDNKIVENTFPDPTFGGVFPGFTNGEWTRRFNVMVDKEFVPYDDFEAGALDSGRWLGQEMVREIRSGALFSRLTSTTNRQSNNLDFVNPQTINSISADVSVTALESTDGRARARLTGYFYQTGGYGPAGDQTGVVQAEVDIRQGTGGPVAYWFITQCTDSSCTPELQTDLATGIIKSVAVGQIVNLSIAYDQTSNQFTFGAGGTTVTQVSPAPRSVPGPPNVQWKAIGTRIGGSGTFYGVRSISATFDNVMVNGLSYDTFSTPTIDGTKWIEREFVREVSGGIVSSGMLVSGITAYDVPLGQSNSLGFYNSNGVAGIKADVTVTAATYGGTAPRARLAGFFYKTYSTFPAVAPLGDQTGEIDGNIGIRYNGTNLEVYWFVIKCTDSQCNAGTGLGTGTFGTVAIGSTHKLSMVWDGSIVTFGMGAATPQTFDPKGLAPVVVPIPPEPWKAIGTRIDGNATAGTGGSIRATFDNVLVRLNPDVSARVPTLICGHIYESESPTTGVAGAGVQITRVEGESTGLDLSQTYGTLTGPGGTYCIGIPRGTGGDYILSASIPGRETMYYAVPPDNGVSNVSASPIGVMEGFTTTKDVSLPLGASISGRVTTGGSTPVGGATVTLFRYTGNIFGIPSTQTTTAKDGTFGFSNLMPADYTVSAFSPGYAVEFYGGAPDSWSATYFSLGVGGSQTNVNIDLNTANGSISGRVTNATMPGAGIPNATVQIRGMYPRGQFVLSRTTDASGNYTVPGLTPGRYMVEVRANGFAEKFYSNGGSRDQADPVTVAAGATTSGINVAVDPPHGSISGFVRDGSGNPVLNSCVGAYDVFGGYVRGGCPSSDGSYAIDLLPPGIYRVDVFDTETGFINQFYSGQRVFAAADNILVSEGSTTVGGVPKSIDFTLAANPGRILGTITRSDTGAPVMGASINIRTFNNDYAGGDASQSDGTYLARGLAFGWYKIRVTHPDFITRYYTASGGASNFSDGAYVQVAAITDTLNINVALVPNPGKITGTVTDGAIAIAGVSVQARLASNLSPVWGTTTRSNGTYELTGLAAGNYIVRATRPGQSGEFDRAVQFYNNKPTQQAADPVTVTAGGTTSNINFALAYANSTGLGGRVTMSDGTTGIEGASVTVYDAATGGTIISATTRSDGTYTVGQLPAGNFKVRASALRFANRYFLSGQPGTPSIDLASPVTNGNYIVNIQLTLSSDVTGTVSYTGWETGPLVVQLFGNSSFTGNPVYSVKLPAPVTFPAPYTFENPIPDTRGVVPGTYYVRAFLDVNESGSPDPTEPQGNYGGTTPSSIVLPEGTITSTGINITLVPLAFNLSVTLAGSSSGSVTSAPAGITCGATCSASFTSGAHVTLTASVGAGGIFREWRGDCTGSGACVVTMNAAKSVTAVFSKTFTDPTLTAGVTPIKAVHFTELRTAIDTLRSRFSLGAYAWTDSSLTPGSTPVKRQHLLDLRTALNQAYTAALRAVPTYTDPTITAGTTPIKAVHLNELRTFVRNLE